MPAYQSIREFNLSAKYHLKAVGGEQQAERATDQSTEQEWRQLAAQWHSMADQAAALREAGLPLMAKEAEAGLSSNGLSLHAMPEMVLRCDLEDARSTRARLVKPNANLTRGERTRDVFRDPTH